MTHFNWIERRIRPLPALSLYLSKSFEDDWIISSISNIADKGAAKYPWYAMLGRKLESIVKKLDWLVSQMITFVFLHIGSLLGNLMSRGI